MLLVAINHDEEAHPPPTIHLVPTSVTSGRYTQLQVPIKFEILCFWIFSLQVPLQILTYLFVLYDCGTVWDLSVRMTQTYQRVLKPSCASASGNGKYIVSAQIMLRRFFCIVFLVTVIISSTSYYVFIYHNGMDFRRTDAYYRYIITWVHVIRPPRHRGKYVRKIKKCMITIN